MRDMAAGTTRLYACDAPEKEVARMLRLFGTTLALDFLDRITWTLFVTYKVRKKMLAVEWDEKGSAVAVTPRSQLELVLTSWQFIGQQRRNRAGRLAKVG